MNDSDDETPTKPSSMDREGAFVHHGRHTKIERYKWRNDTAPGAMRWIDKTDLCIDHRYQRPVNEGKVKRIAAEWSWPALGALIVAERPDGSLWVITGQHRKAAADRRADVTKLPCVVFKMDAVHVEAQAFLTESTQKKPLTSVEKFKALIETGDADASLVFRLLTDAGREAGGSGAGYIRCVTTLLVAAKKDSEQLRRCWPLIVTLCEGKHMQERLIGGLLAMDSLAIEPITTPRWHRRILVVGVEELLAAAGRAAAYYARGGEVVWARGMLQAVNRGLRSRLVFRDEPVEPESEAE